MQRIKYETAWLAPLGKDKVLFIDHNFLTGKVVAALQSAAQKE
jgi:hypothetical protein